MTEINPSLQRYKLMFTAPPSSLEACKDAVFATGAGTYPGEKYSRVSFETAGKGQFFCMEGSKPHIGTPGKLEFVEEIQVNILCVGKDLVTKAVEALKKAHPYEVCAYEVYKLEDF